MELCELLRGLPQDRWLDNLIANTEAADKFLPSAKEVCRKSFDDFWTIDGVPMSREQVAERLEFLGPLAGKIFDSHYKTQLMISAVDPAWVWLTPPYEIDIANDGTATLKAVVP